MSFFFICIVNEILYRYSSVSFLWSLKEPDIHVFPSVCRSSAWQLPFIVKVNSSVVTPPAINSTTFQATFNTTTSWKQHFTVVHPDEVTDKHKIFSVYLNHKVSETAKEDIKNAIIATYIQQHPGMNQYDSKG